MLDLKKYTLDQLFAIQELFEELSERLADYVTDEFIKVTGCQEIYDRLMTEIDERMEDMVK